LWKVSRSIENRASQIKDAIQERIKIWNGQSKETIIERKREIERGKEEGVLKIKFAFSQRNKFKMKLS